MTRANFTHALPVAALDHLCQAQTMPEPGVTRRCYEPVNPKTGRHKGPHWSVYQLRGIEWPNEAVS